MSLPAPLLQLALDVLDLPSALRLLSRAAGEVDVIECGTILILGEGLRAVREVRALYPDKTVLADVRIAEAGGLIASHCFEAGADWVSCVAGASLTTIRQVVAAAAEFDGQVQVETNDDLYSLDRARAWRDAGVEHAIVKRSRDREAAGTLEWTTADLDRVTELAELGFTVSVTGGFTAADLPGFAGLPVGVVIVGREITSSHDPGHSAAAMRAAIAKAWER
jgi:3-dehydro-L-gulonate-6-phosphate decarboxylase